jgi:hypothetical protein
MPRSAVWVLKMVARPPARSLLAIIAINAEVPEVNVR